MGSVLDGRRQVEKAELNHVLESETQLPHWSFSAAFPSHRLPV